MRRKEKNKEMLRRVGRGGALEGRRVERLGESSGHVRR